MAICLTAAIDRQGLLWLWARNDAKRRRANDQDRDDEDYAQPKEPA